MSGPKEYPKQGSGYLEEVASWLEREKRLGHMPCCVIIDYAGLCVKRHVHERGLRDEKYYALLSHFGYECLRLIAQPFDTPVWIMHQLSGEANKRTSATKQHHADAAGSRSFAENLWFCFELGIPDPYLKAMWFTNDIARRAINGEPIIVRLHGGMATIRTAPEVVAQGNTFRLRADTEFTHHHGSHGQPAVLPDTGNDATDLSY
jgi:hypothetical protein